MTSPLGGPRSGSGGPTAYTITSSDATQTPTVIATDGEPACRCNIARCDQPETCEVHRELHEMICGGDA
jgi:hypothetical protein